MQEGVYFMSQTERDAVFGRLVREQRDTNYLIADLEAEAKKFSSSFRSLSEMLQASPDKVIFPGQFDKRAPLGSPPNVDPCVLEIDRLKALVENLRDAMKKRDDLTLQLSKYPQ
jgi:hypothetical protein